MTDYSGPIDAEPEDNSGWGPEGWDPVPLFPSEQYDTVTVRALDVNSNYVAVIYKLKDAPIPEPEEITVTGLEEELLADVFFQRMERILDESEEQEEEEQDDFDERRAQPEGGQELDEAVADILSQCGRYDLNGPFPFYNDAVNYSAAIGVRAISRIGYQYEDDEIVSYYVVIGCSR